nr:hypothetical protein [Tanacetum cinerariifolium]
MENPPPLNHVADLHEDEPVHLEHAPLLEEYDDEDEMEAGEAEEVDVEIDDDADDAEVIHPYKEVDPLNRPPPDSSAKHEAVAAAPAHAAHATLQPLLLFAGPLGMNMGALHSKVKTMARQMKDRKEEDVRAENRELREMLRNALARVEYHHETAEYHRYRFARVSLHYDHLSRWESGIGSVYLETRSTERDADVDPVRDDDDDSAAPRDPQPSQPLISLYEYSWRFSLCCDRIMPPKKMTQAAIKKLISDRVAAAIAQDHATRGNTSGASRSGGNTNGNAGGQGGAPPARE